MPKQHSSGGKQTLLGISKRGNRYIRTLLVHGARSVLSHCSNNTDKLSLWLQALIDRRGFNKAAVAEGSRYFCERFSALAHKNARIMWAIANSDKGYKALA